MSILNEELAQLMEVRGKLMYNAQNNHDKVV